MAANLLGCNLESLDCSSVIQFLQLFYLVLKTVPSVPNTTGITKTFMFHSVFSSLARFRYSSIYLLFSLSIYRRQKQQNISRWQILFYLIINIKPFLASIW